MKKKTKIEWSWPYVGRGEIACVHFVGHGPHVHGCDGCCDNKEYHKKIKRIKVKHTLI